MKSLPETNAILAEMFDHLKKATSGFSGFLPNRHTSSALTSFLNAYDNQKTTFQSSEEVVKFLNSQRNTVSKDATKLIELIEDTILQIGITDFYPNRDGKTPLESLYFDAYFRAYPATNNDNIISQYMDPASVAAAMAARAQARRDKGRQLLINEIATGQYKDELLINPSHHHRSLNHDSEANKASRAFTQLKF